MDEPGRRFAGPGCDTPIDAFARALIGLQGDDALHALIQDGPPERLRRQVFAPAARRLGDWWVSDEICFATVTLGMVRLQRLAWTYGRAPPGPLPRPAPLLLTLMPGEQHSFGLNLLAEDLRERGVEPAVLPAPSRQVLLAAAASGGFEIIGLSVGSEPRLAEVAPLARALRQASPRPLRILAGGPVAERLDPASVDEIASGEDAAERLCCLVAEAAYKTPAAAA